MRIDLRRRGPELAFTLGAFGVAMLVGLHLLPSFGGIDPVHGMLSEYPLLGRFDVSALYFLGLLAVNAAAVALGTALSQSGLLRGPSTALLTTWCVSLLGLTIFPTHPPGTSDTWHGHVHMVYATVNFVSLPLLGVLLWLQFRRTEPWKAYAQTVGALAWVTAAAAIPFVVQLVADGGSQATAGLGLIERCIIAIDVAVMVALMCWSKALTRTGASATATTSDARVAATLPRAFGVPAAGAQPNRPAIGGSRILPVSVTPTLHGAPSHDEGSTTSDSGEPRVGAISPVTDRSRPSVVPATTSSPPSRFGWPEGARADALAET